MCPSIGVHRRTSLMSLSLLLQCQACLVRLSWMVCKMSDRWLYNCCFVRCCFQDLFQTTQHPCVICIIFFSKHLVNFQVDISKASLCNQNGYHIKYHIQFYYSILAKSTELKLKLRKKIQLWFEWATAAIGLHVNAHKTEYMCYNQTGDISTLGGTSLKLIDKFTYLGSSVSSTKKDIDTWLTKAMDSYR